MSVLEEKVRAVLAHASEVTDLVEVYVDEGNLDHFVVGFVERVGSETVCLLSVDEDGEYDGRIMARLDEIIRIHVGGDYLESLKVLHEGRGKVFDPEPTDPFQREFLDFTTSLTFARDHRVMVTVYEYDKGTTLGFVSDLGEEWVQIEPILGDGRSNGFMIFRIEDIVRIDVGGKREQARGFVHQARLGR